jgi:hypothetical protein
LRQRRETRRIGALARETLLAAGPGAGRLHALERGENCVRISTSRLAAAVSSGVLFGLYMHHDYMTWSLRGRYAFIQDQTQRFDRFMLSPRFGATVIEGTMAIVLGLGAYELLAALFAKIMRLAGEDKAAATSAGKGVG